MNRTMQTAITQTEYSAFQTAYDFFNAELFSGTLPAVLITLQRRGGSRGYFAPEKFVSRSEETATHELAWLSVCCLHYSDSTDRRLAMGVSILDSIALLFVVIHLAGLLYIYGHHRALRSAEARYEAAAEKYNAQAREVQNANVEIARAAERIAQETTKTARLENDRAYQLRRAAEAGARAIPRSTATPAAAPGLTTSAVELERPTRPTESSATFLAKWDWLVRLANGLELLLACLTMIVIRTQSARTNSPTTQADELPSVFAVSSRSPLSRPALSKTATRSDTVSRQNVEHKRTTPYDTAALREGLKVLREQLRLIAFRTPGQHYKADIRGDAVWVRAMTSDAGIQRTAHGAKAKLSILRDALRMPPEQFRAKLEKFLVENGFEL